MVHNLLHLQSRRSERILIGGEGLLDENKGGEEMKKELVAGLIGMLMCFVSGVAQATPFFWGPSPYLSASDIPVEFYDGSGPTALEDFEDGTLDYGITASKGYVISNDSFPNSIDSVGQNDGKSGHSWFSSAPDVTMQDTLSFTFASPITVVGIVWTDGDPLNPTSFEAFRGTESLGKIGPVYLGDSNFLGDNIEDRFFGVQDLDGITSIAFHYFSGIEVDHIQYGCAPSVPVPEPTTMLLFGIGIAGLVGARLRRKKNRHESQGH